MPISGVCNSTAGTVGNRVRWGTTDWNVVGVFEDGGSVAESEVWTDASVLQGVYNRGNSYQSMRVRLTSAGAARAFEDRITTDPRLNVRIFTEKEYFEQQSQTLQNVLPHLAVMFLALDGRSEPAVAPPVRQPLRVVASR